MDIQYNRNEEFRSVEGDEETISLDDDKYVENTVIFVPNVWSLMPTNIEYQKQVEAYQALIEQEPEWINEIDSQQNGDPSESIKTEVLNISESSTNNISAEEIKEPTHYSKLDLKKMKVDELRNELGARGLDTKGLKPQLIVRLKEAIESEKVILILNLFMTKSFRYILTLELLDNYLKK